MNLPQRQTARLPHGSITWRETGEGPAVVLLHGLNGNAASWIRQYEALGGFWMTPPCMACWAKS